jgi:ATP-dependent Clp protease ATP-binding subunit ClpC
MAENKHSEKITWQNAPFLLCDHCLGTGKINGKTCENCQGIGAAVYYQGYLFHWSKVYNSVLGKLHKFNLFIHRLINFVLLGLFLAASAWLGWHIYNVYLFEYNFWFLLDWQWWLQANIHLLAFYAAGLLLCFFAYRVMMYGESKSNLQILSQNLSGETKNPAQFALAQGFSELLKNKVPLLDVYKYASPGLLASLERAWDLTISIKGQEVTPLHLLGGLLDEGELRVLLMRLGIGPADFGNKLVKALILQQRNMTPNTMNTELSWNINLRKILIYAGLDAWDSNFRQVSELNALYSVGSVEYVINQYNLVKDVLEEFKINPNILRNIIEWGKLKQRLRDNLSLFRELARLKPTGNMNRSMTATFTPLLNNLSQDYTRSASYGYFLPCLNRDRELEDILQSIESTQQSVLLVGHNGIGKTSIIEGIAQLMVMEKVPAQIQDKRLLVLDLPTLLSSVPPQSLAQVLQQLIQEIGSSRNIVLVLENLEMLANNMGASFSLLEVILQALENRVFYCIATTTPQAYVEFLENSKVPQVMTVLQIQELDLDSNIQIIEGQSGYLENKQQVFFTYDAIAKAVKLSDEYIYDQYLPAKAIKVLESTALSVKQQRGSGAVVLGEDVAKEIAEKTGIPLTQLTQDEAEKLLNLEKEIHRRVVGQEEAVEMVSSSLRRARAELRDTNRPIANFLFVGPTGVGKTELAKAVSEVYFGNEEAMIRFDMSEYQDKASISRLIGQNKEGGLLTEAVRRKPFALLLFDELEKAHPDILNLFLQILDDGRLTDGLGRTVDFSNSIIIATSNAGAKYIQGAISQNLPMEEIKEHLLKVELQNYYRPEFLNRFDGIITFKPLSPDNILAITRLLLIKVQKRLQTKQITVDFSDEFIRELAAQGFDPLFGARPLKRVIQNKVEDSLANYLLSAKIKSRDKVIFEAGGQIRVEEARRL